MLQEKMDNSFQKRTFGRELSGEETVHVNGGFALLGIIFPILRANDRTQGDVTNISDIIAA